MNVSCHHKGQKHTRTLPHVGNKNGCRLPPDIRYSLLRVVSRLRSIHDFLVFSANLWSEYRGGLTHHDITAKLMHGQAHVSILDLFFHWQLLVALSFSVFVWECAYSLLQVSQTQVPFHGLSLGPTDELTPALGTGTT